MSRAKYVLIVEDEDDIRSMMVESLKAATLGLDFYIMEAKDGREAIGFAARQQFHCIVTDLNMPRTGGEEFIRTLLGDAMNANTPTIVVSGNLSEEFINTVRNVRVIAKPFIPTELTETILREVKQGRLDERVPVHLLNPVLDSLQKILREDLKSGKAECSLQPPAVRKAGEKVEGELYVTFTLTTGLTQARFGLAFNRSWLQWLKGEYFSSRRDQWAAMTSELAARQATLAVVEKAQAHLTAIFGSIPRVAELSITDLDVDAKAHEAAKVGGISIGLNTEQGPVHATALAPVKAKRLAA